MKRIFIQIASYRDPELAPTIESLIKNADFPERLSFGICWQHSPSDYFEIANQKSFRPGFRVVDVPFEEARGVCWARSQISDLYDGEEFTLQIDSHMRFDRHWDSNLINLYHDTQEDWECEKPILTTYPPEYTPGNDNDGRMSHAPMKIVFNGFTEEGLYTSNPEVISDWHLLRKPIRARFYAAGFSFTTGQFCEEVPHDPDLYFFGEELNIAARAFTRGYDLFHPHFSVCRHYYTREGMPRQWDDQPKDWSDLDTKSKDKMRRLLGYKRPPEVIEGVFGLGSVRTLHEFQDYIGLEFGPIPKVHQSLLLGSDPVLRGELS